MDGFIPTTVIGREPSGGGTLFEAVNLLQPKRINSFVSDGTATEFLLDSMGIDTAEVTVWVDGEEKSEGEDYTVDREAGKVFFTQAPADSAGLDSVTIRFSKTVTGYRERICKCTIAGLSLIHIWCSGRWTVSCGKRQCFYAPKRNAATGRNDGFPNRNRKDEEK